MTTRGSTDERVAAAATAAVVESIGG